MWTLTFWPWCSPLSHGFSRCLETLGYPCIGTSKGRWAMSCRLSWFASPHSLHTYCRMQHFRQTPYLVGSCELHFQRRACRGQSLWGEGCAFLSRCHCLLGCFLALSHCAHIRPRAVSWDCRAFGSLFNIRFWAWMTSAFAKENDPDGPQASPE